MISASDAKNSIWVASALSGVILILRLALSWRLRTSTILTRVLLIVSLLVCFLRLANDYYLLLDGTVNDALAGQTYFNSSNAHRLKTGSILALLARLLDTTYFWLQAALLLTFYSALTNHVRWVPRMIKATWIFMLISYVAVLLATFLECHPFSRYTQVSPNPGQCVKAYVQLFLQGLCNIIIDLMLLSIAYPLIRVRSRTRSHTVRISVILIIGTFCIIVTAVKLAYVYGKSSTQTARSLWASVQLVVSTFVANAPTIYGAARVMMRQKQDQGTRRGSVPEKWQGNSIITPTRSRLTNQSNSGIEAENESQESRAFTMASPLEAAKPALLREDGNSAYTQVTQRSWLDDE